MLLRSLLALTVIIVTARVVGRAFRSAGQPAVMGEIVGGILLGPSFLGALAPGAYAQLIPSDVLPFLTVHAQLGVVLFLFLVGLELDLTGVKKNGRTTLAISIASLAAPFLLGVSLATMLPADLSPDGVPLTLFALFIGTSLSVTAFPVLARILADLNLTRSPLGGMALTSAAVADVAAWCLLAIVAGMARAQIAAGVRTFALTALFTLVMLRLVRPWLSRYVARLDAAPRLSRTGLSTVLIGMLAAAMTTELIGIHGLFGAFVFGAIIPHRSRLAADLDGRLGDFVGVLFLPAFFALTGMRTQIGLLEWWTDWILCGAIVATACVGKFGGTVAAARWAGLQWRDSAALGALMNTRGLVELIVLNIGLELQVITPRLFTMLVIMALVTTLMATPIVRRLMRHGPGVDDEREAATAG